MVCGVVLGPQRNQPEAGSGKRQRHEEVGGHERPVSHDRERTRLGRSGLGLVTQQILCREGGQAVGAQSIAASCGTQPDYSCFNWITFTLTNLLTTAGIATPTTADWMARLDSALTILLLLVVVVDDYLI